MTESTRTQTTISFLGRRKIRLLLILMAAMLIRFALALYLGNEVSGLSGAHDEISYSILGYRFATGYGMTFPENWYPWIKAGSPQSYYSYTISLLLAGVYSLFGYQPLVARVIMALLSGFVVLMTYVLARRIFGETVGLISASISAVYAYLVFYGVTLTTETPFTLALLVCLYAAYRIRERPSTALWILLGVCLAVAVLLRMAVIFFVPFLFAWLAWELRRNHKEQLRMILVPCIMILLAVLPYTIRNFRLWGRFMVLESQFGHVFWNGNHPEQYASFNPTQVFAIPPEILANGNDAEITTRLLRLGIENVLHDPGRFVALTASRLGELFKFWPTEDSDSLANILRVGSFGIVFPLAIVGILSSFKLRSDLIPIYGFMIIHTSVYAISWTMVRYRVPMDPFFIMFASFTLVLVYTWVTNLFRQRQSVFS